MKYFPLFLDVTNKKILIVGGGKIANDKFQKIKQFDFKEIKVIAREFTLDFNKSEETRISYDTRSFLEKDLEGMDFVVVAIDDLKLQKEIQVLCAAEKIFVNCVDVTSLCDFIFPAMILKENLTIAVSTSGVVPGLSYELKEYIDRNLPPQIETTIKDLKTLRDSLPKGKERMLFIREKAKEFINRTFLILLLICTGVITGCAQLKIQKDYTVTEKLFIVEREDQSLAVIEADREIKRVNELGSLHHATMKFYQGFGYLLARDGFISKIDVKNNQLIKKIKHGKSGIGITFYKNFVITVNYDPNSVVIMDLDLNIVKEIKTDSRNVGVKVYEDFIVFSLMDKNEIQVINGAEDFKLVKKIENAGQLPFDALIKDQIYIVGFFNEASVGMLDLKSLSYKKIELKNTENQLVTKVPHFGYWGIVDNLAIIPMANTHKLLAINLQDLKPIKEIEVIGNPVFASVSPDKKSLVVSYSGDQENFVSVIDTKKLEKVLDFKAGERVMHLRFSKNGKSLYTSSYFENQLNVFETNNWKNVEKIKVKSPSGIFIEEIN